ncbi:hypothetical protein [Pendulispora albinea]|uniref:Uncharacterized protein n=1 Tax=Pendulispora albinea TaxID=2741071 RepID=A0ABZ2LMC2_9BACT
MNNKTAKDLDPTKNPAGPVQLSDEELEDVSGAGTPLIAATIGASVKYCSRGFRKVRGWFRRR